MMLEFTRTTELKAFLTACRGRLRPKDFGLPSYPDRRRNAGLRREEVATLANVSFTWYSWFESGRRTDVSPDFLERLAAVLRLTQIEVEYLFALAGLLRRPPFNSPIKRTASQQALMIVNGFSAGPAIVIDRYYNVLSWNSIAAALYGYRRVPGRHINLLHNFFGSERARNVHPDWGLTSRQIVGTFRLEFAKHIEDQAYTQLLGKLASISPAFDKLWKEQFVEEWPEHFSFMLPELGHTVTAHFAVASVLSEPNEKIHLHTLSDDKLAKKFLSAVRSEAH
jgi:transcriptional regulator with XRE-family HTH domain